MRIFVGLESNLDLRIKLDSTEGILELSKKTKSGLGKELRLAYKSLKKERGDEIPIDGGDSDTLTEELKETAKIVKSTGGNAAIEASELMSLGADVSFIGKWFPHQAKRTLFSKVDFSLAEKSRLNPVSIILQTDDERFILCNGRGRRFQDIKNCIKNLPEIVKKERPDALILVGWHVIFANGISDDELDFVLSSLEKTRKSGVLMLTDTGGFGEMGQDEIKKLWKIYRMFDAVSVNEHEILNIAETFGFGSDEDETLRKIAGKEGNIRTVWLHTRDYQKSVSLDFSPEALAEAQEFASSAGCLRVETGRFPSEFEINERDESGRSSFANGIVRTECLKARKIKTHVGAGDVSCAAFFRKLLEN